MQWQRLIYLAMLLGTISAQNYHHDMLSGRTRGIIASLFGGTGGAGGGLFPFLGPKPDLAAIIDPNAILTRNRLRTVERNLAAQTRLNTAQAAQLVAQAAQIADLQAAIAALPVAGAAAEPACPAVAVNAEYIADLGRCYSVEVAGLPFLDAQTDCQEKGGELAEFPVANRDDFMTALNGNADLMTAIVGIAPATPLFIGLHRTAVDALNGLTLFTFLSGAPTVDSTDNNIFNAVTGDKPNIRQAVAIEAPNGAFLERMDDQAGSAAALDTLALPYICQYDTIPG